MEVKRKQRSEEEHVEADIEIKYVKKRKEECVVLSADIIIHEILPWVPLKALFRFKLVCKEWCRAISTDSLFKKTQSRRCASLSPVGIIYHGHKNYVLLPTTMDKELVGLPNLSLNKYKVICDQSHNCLNHHINHWCSKTLLASSNGLLCGSYFRDMNEYFYVSNPLTQELVSIPNTHNLRDLTLAFETSTDYPYYVLVGRTVVKADYDKKITDIRFTVYSSTVGTWKVVNAITQIFRPCFGTLLQRSQCRSVYAGGKLHWKLKKDVLWFDIKEECAGVVAFPGEEKHYPRGEIGDCYGQLSYIEISASEHLTSSTSENIIIWGLKSYQKNRFNWVQKYCVSLRKIFEDQKDFTCCYDTFMFLTEKLHPIFTHGRPKKNRKKSSTHGRPLPYKGGDAMIRGRPLSYEGEDGMIHGRPLPYEGEDAVMFWVKKRMGAGEGILISYNKKTGSLQLNHESEPNMPLLSYKPSLVSLPKLAE